MPLERAALRSSEAQSSSVDQVAHHNGSQVEHQDVVVFVHAPPAGAFAIDCETKFTGEFGGGDTPQPFSVGSTGCSFSKISDIDVGKKTRKGCDVRR